jgi:hypothetical protein
MLLIYLVFFFLILRFTVTLFNFISNPKLTRSGKVYHELVSILIPAGEKLQSMQTLFPSIQGQEYQNFEVIVLTGPEGGARKIPPGFPVNDTRFKILSGHPLPNGWLAKNYACCQLAREASGKYLLFLGPDQVISNGLINNSVHRMNIGRLTLLSLFPNQSMFSFAERLVVPLINFVLLNLLPLRLVRLSKNPAFSAASGQFMLFEAQNYHQHQWHELVRNIEAGDIEIMKLVKTNKFRCEALLANGYLYSRMFRGFKEALRGFSNTLLAGFNNSVMSLSLYVLLVFFGPLAIALYVDSQLFVFALGLILLSRIMISLASGQNPWVNILLHPLQMTMLLILSVVSIKNYFVKPNSWRAKARKPSN